MKRYRAAARVRQLGAAALLVVVVLFFILAMVTAYAGRNLIFEQRTSVNSQRAAQAFEAAESGLDFAIALLSGGRVTEACVPTTDVGLNTFRQRHLTADVDGIYTMPGAQAGLLPTCMLLPDDPRCSCRTAGAPQLILPVGGLTPTFQVRFEGVGQPGIVRAVSRGCSSIGTECYAAAPSKADAVAEVSVLLGLNSALATPPSAALTVRQSLDANGGALAVVNTDVPTRGLTINTGGAIVNADSVRLSSVPGTPGMASVIANDPSLGVDLANADRMFASVFGMDRATYRSQPAAVRVTCAGNCATQIATAVSQNPGRVIWVQGPATIDSAQVWGTANVPVMLLVQGNLTVTANLQLFGVLYLQGDATTWATNAGSTLVQGAVMAEGDLSVVGAPTIVFDPGVLRTISRTQGSLVRVPGSWRDFAAGS